MDQAGVAPGLLAFYLMGDLDMKRKIINGIALVFTVSLCTAFILCGLKMYSFSVEADSLRRQREADCVQLNPRYGSLYTPKAGFYRGIQMVVVAFPIDGGGTLNLYIYPYNDSSQRFTFFCNELEAVR